MTQPRMSQRRRQVVSSKRERLTDIRWMVNRVNVDGTDSNIASKAVDAFPRIFPNPYNSFEHRRNHRSKALRWWRSRNDFFEKMESEEDGRLYETSTNAIGVNRRRWSLKSMSGRGKKREAWVLFVYEYLDEEFEILTELGVKLTSRQ